jgi:hypothetical protein
VANLLLRKWEEGSKKTSWPFSGFYINSAAILVFYIKKNQKEKNVYRPSAVDSIEAKKNSARNYKQLYFIATI